MENILGVLISFIYTVTVMIVAVRLKRLPYHFTRYFTHMMVANGWFLSRALIDDPLYALIVPALYLGFTLLNHGFRWFESLNSMVHLKNFGAIYFGISYFLLTLVAYSYPNIALGAGMGLMVMAYGDGLAAMVGLHAGKLRYTIFTGYKTFEGSLTMWLVSMVVIALLTLFQFNSVMWPMVFLVASLAAFVEALSPYGLDNLFIPFLVFLSYILMIL